MEKLEDVMMNNEWKTEEIEHLQQLYDALSMHSEWLIPNTEKAEEDFDAFKIFTYKWLAFAQKNWDGLMICFLLLLGLQIELKL